ncbi:hypothetical protein BWQ96_04073 [Gracilariopsis chorda]|uniref:Uncharacterized protein n=1 Tax=Gracilariopsis chorda TaxID=448386 RepID=A0A2V3IVM4_9FLOR|nr:hypothetical protein BWQ96_04073 [Gracilariopsis chorda]|eukprot:PXF46196.1 hypothetical protein BWQ96_04073 [Gracilariopsis chorda]
MYYLIVARPSDHSFLVESNSQLPTIPYSGTVTHYLRDVLDQVQMKLKHDLKLNFLRVECWSFEESWQTLIVFEVLGERSTKAPKNCKWVTQSAADKVALVPPSETVREYLKKYKVHGLEVNGERLYSFSGAGWFESASTWIKRNLSDFGEEVESIEKLQHGLGSCVLKVRVRSGTLFYMKCSKRMRWWNEVGVTCALAEVMPETFNKPLAVDMERGWMLMRDYGKTLPYELFETDLDMAKRVTCYWAEVQKKICITRSGAGGTRRRKSRWESAESSG